MLVHYAGGPDKVNGLGAKTARVGLKGLSGGATVVGSAYVSKDEIGSSTFQSMGAHGISVMGTGSITAGVGLTGPGAIAIFVMTGGDIASEFITGEKLGLLDMTLLNTPRAIATGVEIAATDRGWDAVADMSRRVRTEQGWYGQWTGFVADHMVGPLLGEAYNFASGEGLRSTQLKTRSLLIEVEGLLGIR